MCCIAPFEISQRKTRPYLSKEGSGSSLMETSFALASERNHTGDRATMTASLTCGAAVSRGHRELTTLRLENINQYQLRARCLPLHFFFLSIATCWSAWTTQSYVWAAQGQGGHFTLHGSFWGMILSKLASVRAIPLLGLYSIVVQKTHCLDSLYTWKSTRAAPRCGIPDLGKV